MTQVSRGCGKTAEALELTKAQGVCDVRMRSASGAIKALGGASRSRAKESATCACGAQAEQ